MKASKGYKLNDIKTGCIDVNECEEKLGCQGISINKDFQSNFLKIHCQPLSLRYARMTYLNTVKIQLEVINVYQIIYQ